MHTALRPAPTWDACRHLLQGRLSAQQFRRWLATPDLAASVRNENGYWVLTLACATPQHCSELGLEVGTTIERAWHELCQTASRVEYTAQAPAAKPVAERRSAKVIQFPLFPDETRPVSNDLVRCALFAAIQSKDRQHHKDYTKLAALDGYEIWIKGYEFNQEDNDAFMQLVFMAQYKPLGEDVSVSFRSFVAGIGRGYGSNARKAAADAFERLIASTVKIVNKIEGTEYIGHLVHDGFLPRDRQRLPRLERDLTYHLNARLLPFFEKSAFTLIDWNQRQTLKGDLARWLQLYIASHADPFPVKVEMLHKLSGSRTRQLKHFRANLKVALKALKANSDIENWHIDDHDLVHIERTPSASQARHLLKKITGGAKRGIASQKQPKE